MRLAVVTQDFPPDVGGIQSFALEAAHFLAPRCDDFAVVAPRVPDCELVDARLPFEVVRVPASYDTLSVAAAPALQRLIRRRGFDTTLHIQWPTALSALIARRLGWSGRLFILAHGRELLLDPLGHVPGLGPFYRRLRRRALAAAAHTFANSHFTAGLLHDLGVPEARIDVVYGGADTERFRPLPADQVAALRERLGVTGRRVLFTLCRLVERKGIDTALRALPTVVESVPETLFLIGGTGPDRPRLEALVRQVGMADHVRFLGRVEEPDISAYYHACDVFTMPSRSIPPHVEGLGLVFLEANACERPVVAARDGGVPDAVEHEVSGLLVPPGDPPALARALTRVLSDPALAQKYGRQGRARVLECFTWNTVIGRIHARLSDFSEPSL